MMLVVGWLFEFVDVVDMMNLLNFLVEEENWILEERGKFREFGVWRGENELLMVLLLLVRREKFGEVLRSIFEVIKMVEEMIKLNEERERKLIGNGEIGGEGG